MAKHFLNLMIGMNLHPKILTNSKDKLKEIYIKTYYNQTTKIQRENLKAARKKWLIIYKSSSIRLTGIFHQIPGKQTVEQLIFFRRQREEYGFPNCHIVRLRFTRARLCSWIYHFHLEILLDPFHFDSCWAKLDPSQNGNNRPKSHKAFTGKVFMKFSNSWY